MVDLLPRPFKKSSPSLKSFSFSEFASGTGFVKFFLADQADTVGTSYLLTEQTPAADTGQVATTNGSDVDFDLGPFNKAVIVDGVANLNIFTKFATAGGSHNWVYTAIIRKWDGTTETDIVTQVGAQEVISASSSGIVLQLMQITIPRTTLARGDQLRLTLTATGEGGNFLLQIDPSNAGGEPNNSSIEIPFDADL